MVQNSNDLQSLSITSCFNLAKSFFTSQENNSAFKSLTTTSEGVFIIRWLATILSNISYRVVSYMREIYISTANLLSSVLGISVNLGYSAYRGSNQRRKITITPTQTVVIPKYSIIGTYSTDYDIITVEDITLQTGTQQDIITVIGKVKTVQKKAGTSELDVFTFYTENISEDVMVLKDNVEVPYSKYAKNMSSDTYWLRTNPFNSVDLLYMNNVSSAQYKYDVDSVFTLKYIELADVPTIPYTNSMFTYFTLDNTRVINKYIAPETVGRVKVTAPLHHETQNIIRSKKDYPKRLPEIDTSIIQSDYNVITPAYAEVSYLKNDYSLLTDEERADILSTLDDERALGIPLPDLQNPKRELMSLNVGVKPLNTFVTLADVTTDVQSILDTNYGMLLNQSLNIYDLEKLVEQLSYVKYCRSEFNVTNRANSNYQNVGDLITTGGIIYKVTDVVGETGSSEPLWNVPLTDGIEIDTGMETTDGTLVWRIYKRLDIYGVGNWTANTLHKIGDYVYLADYPHYMAKVVDLIKYNDLVLSAYPPAFDSGSTGDFVNDGDIVWVRKLLNSSNDVRTGNTIYRLGDNVRLGDYSYECIGYRGELGTSLPTYELIDYTISGQGTDYFEISGDYTSFFQADNVLQVFVSSTEYYSFSVSSAEFINSTNKTVVSVNQVVDLGKTYTTIRKANVGTFDGNLFCEIVEDSTNYTTDWKTFNDFSLNLTLL